MKSPSIYAMFDSTGGQNRLTLKSVPFCDLRGFEGDDLLQAAEVFKAGAQAFMAGIAATRPAQPVAKAFAALCERIRNRPISSSLSQAREFFVSSFTPYKISSGNQSGPVNGFLTGYYEPELEGSLIATKNFTAPILARPKDLITSKLGNAGIVGRPELSAGRLSSNGTMVPYFNREQIETSAPDSRLTPIVWLRDAVEVFLVQVQGSARVRLPDGRLVRLGYAGRNGHPYTSIGRILIDTGEIMPDEMSLASLKHWIRSAGQLPDQPGRQLMQRNRSYVFFKQETTLDETAGPIGAAGVSLTPMRSIAVDRALWYYGLPFWIDAELPINDFVPELFQRLMIAQDTGSAIVGPGRIDVFIGSGAEAGQIAGGIRHHARVHVLLPNTDGG